MLPHLHDGNRSEALMLLQCREEGPLHVLLMCTKLSWLTPIIEISFNGPAVDVLLLPFTSSQSRIFLFKTVFWLVLESVLDN